MSVCPTMELEVAAWTGTLIAPGKCWYSTAQWFWWTSPLLFCPSTSPIILDKQGKFQMTKSKGTLSL